MSEESIVDRLRKKIRYRELALLNVNGLSRLRYVDVYLIYVLCKIKYLLTGSRI